jgi:hypothetical protein
MAGGSPSPWHSQQQHSHAHNHPHHHHTPAHGLPYTTAGFSIGGYGLDAAAGYNNNNNSNPFCNDHHHHHDHDNNNNGGHHHHHHIADPLGVGLHSGAGVTTSLFQERELELQMGRMTNNNALGGGQMTKHEWEDGFDGI